MAGKIGKAGKFLGVAGAFLGVVLQIVNDVQESNLEENLRETRNDIREGFRSAAQVIEMEFDKQTNTWVAKEIDGGIQEVDEAIAELENLRKIEDKEYQKIKFLLNQVKTLIREIQESQE